MTLTLLLRVVVHKLYTIYHASRRTQDCSCAVAYMYLCTGRRSLLATFFFCKHSRQLSFVALGPGRLGEGFRHEEIQHIRSTHFASKRQR